MDRKRAVAVMGAGNCGQSESRWLPHWEDSLPCVAIRASAAACAANKGAYSAGGLSIGILPGLDRRDPAESDGIHIATGLGHRSYLVVLNADVVVAMHGGWAAYPKSPRRRKLVYGLAVKISSQRLIQPRRWIE